MQLKRLEHFLTVDRPLAMSPNAAIIATINRRHNVPLFARLSPFTSTDAVASANNLSWTGPQGLVNEIVLISHRVSADDGCPVSDESNGIVRYDKFHAKSTWDAPQDVSTEDLLGDEEAIVRAGISVMGVVPTEFESDVYNEDESMQLSPVVP